MFQHFSCLGMGYNGQPIYSEIKLMTDSENIVVDAVAISYYYDV